MYNRIMTLSYVNERKEESLSSGMPSKDEKEQTNRSSSFLNESLEDEEQLISFQVWRQGDDLEI